MKLPGLTLIDRVLSFIRSGSHGLETIAIVICTVDPTKVKDVATTVETLKYVTTDWLKNTKKGREAWTYSGGDFNIGDLAQYDTTFIKSRSKMLKMFGIHDFKIICIVDNTECIPYDTVLFI
jgi:hypothetical protein